MNSICLLRFRIYQGIKHPPYSSNSYQLSCNWSLHNRIVCWNVFVSIDFDKVEDVKTVCCQRKSLVTDSFDLRDNCFILVDEPSGYLKNSNFYSANLKYYSNSFKFVTSYSFFRVVYKKCKIFIFWGHCSEARKKMTISIMKFLLVCIFSWIIFDCVQC